MKISNLLVTTIGAGLILSSVAFASGKGEVVDQKSLPAAVQKTITEKAAGGKVVRVEREDDKDGKWNYEVLVKSEGKEWGFEIAPDGTFLKKHDDMKKTAKVG